MKDYLNKLENTIVIRLVKIIVPLVAIVSGFLIPFISYLYSIKIPIINVELSEMLVVISFILLFITIFVACFGTVSVNITMTFFLIFFDLYICSVYFVPRFNFVSTYWLDNLLIFGSIICVNICVSVALLKEKNI